MSGSARYVTGSTARKYDYDQVYNNTTKKRVVKVVKNESMKIKHIVLISCLFVMLMTITYRFNVINASNLEIQKLKTQLNTAQSSLASAEMIVGQRTDLMYIEEYAKQKLGMQKPDKNQVVYIDTSKDLGVIKSNNNSFVDKLTESIKGYINKLN